MTFAYMFAGLAVIDYGSAYQWYVNLMGRPADMFPHDREAVWQLTPHSAMYVVRDQDRAGNGLLTLAVDDLAAHERRLTDAGISFEGARHSRRSSASRRRGSGPESTQLFPRSCTTLCVSLAATSPTRSRAIRPASQSVSSTPSGAARSSRSGKVISRMAVFNSPTDGWAIFALPGLDGHTALVHTVDGGLNWTPLLPPVPKLKPVTPLKPRCASACRRPDVVLPPRRLQNGCRPPHPSLRSCSQYQLQRALRRVLPSPNRRPRRGLRVTKQAAVP